MWSKNLGEALRRINEGAAMIRSKGEPGTGNVVQAVHHLRKMKQEIARLVSHTTDELYHVAKELQVPFDLVQYVHQYQNCLLSPLLLEVLQPLPMLH